MKEVSTVFWAVGGNSMQEAMKNLEQYSKEELIQLAVNTRLNKFLSEYGSFRDDDEDPRGHGKRVPYIGWFWRAVDFANKNIPIGDCGEFVGFMENNERKSNMNLTFKKLHPDAVLPSYAHEGASGMDLHAVEDVVLLPGVPTLVRTGLAVELPEGERWPIYDHGNVSMAPILFEAQIRPRARLALKHGITVVNSPGTVGPGFRGEIGVILRWDGHTPNALNGNVCECCDLGALVYTAKDDPLLWKVNENLPALLRSKAAAYRIRKGDRIAQMVIAPVVRVTPQWGDVGETERGSGGFGSTGK